MTGIARKVRWRGIGTYRDEAEPMLEHAGDVAGVVRGRPRSVVIACPDGCGDTLVINLDPRAGKAWDLELRGGVTLYPSVWRDDGCRSHFIVWRSRILWCDRFTQDNKEPEYESALEEAVTAALSYHQFRSGYDIATEIGEISWDVIRVLRILASDGRAEQGMADQRDHYRRGSKR